MAATIQAIKGTKDTLPAESHKIQYVERTALETAAAFGFHEMRTPVASIEGYLGLALNPATTLRS